jgi:hypothetical protein
MLQDVSGSAVNGHAGRRAQVQSQVPDVAQWLIRFAYGVNHGGSDEELVADRGGDMNRGSTYLMAVLPQIFGSLGGLINLSGKISEWAGRIDRIAELQEVLDDVEAAAKATKLESAAAAVGAGAEAAAAPKIELSSVDIVTPRGEAIAVGVSCEVAPGRSMMVTGRNATGQSAFVRVVCAAVGGKVICAPPCIFH